MARESGISRSATGWKVRWKELQATVECGTTTRRWVERSRILPTHEAAVAFKAETRLLAARGERWEDKREVPVATIRSACLDYVRAAIQGGAPLATQRFRSAMIGSFLDFVGAREEGERGARRPVSDLSLSLLANYADSLPADGRAATTRHRKVMEVEKMWAWAFDRPESYPGTPLPRRLTGSGSADRIRPPAPVVAVAAPTWGDVDSMISSLRIGWHRRVALIMRYTGLRASQATGLRWDDFDLDRCILRIPAGRTGAKKGRARVIPLHNALVAEMAGWGVREGLLFPRRYRDAEGQRRPGAYRGDALAEPFRRAWTEAGVPVERWGIPAGGDAEEERGHGSPTHAIRRCIRTQLLRAGVEEAVVLYLIGHSQGATAAAYVPEGAPEQSPWWPRMVAAVDAIPDHRDSGDLVQLKSAQ